MASRYRALLTLLTVTATAIFVWGAIVSPRVPIHGFDWILLVTYFALLTLAQAFPVRIGDQSVNITMGIELPLFLQFGPVITIMVMIVSWIASKVSTGRSVLLKRAIANSSMYSIMVFSSAGVYHLVGGRFPIDWTSSLVPSVIPILAFLITHLVLNYFISFSFAMADGQADLWTTGVMWDLAAFVTEVLIAWLFIFLLHIFGAIAFLFIAIPFAAVLYMFNLYSYLLLANQQLTIISEITAEVSAKVEEEDLLHTLMTGIFDLVRTTTCYYFEWDEEGGMLRPISVKGPTRTIEEAMEKVRVRSGDGVTGMAFHKHQAFLQNRPNELTLERNHEGNVPTKGASILAVPLLYQDQALGVLTLTHEESHAYSKRDQEMVQILSSHVAIAMWNVRRFVKTKERTYIDDLTSLYNYRYFEKIITELCAMTDQIQHELVLLVLDIDHFKQINDTYGHLTGNEILKGIAKLLKEQVREMDVVCRYGGEEFTVILPKANLEVGEQIAERLRKTIEGTHFHLPQTGQAVQLPIRVTVSVGIATYPDMGDSPLDLLKHADRAMYVGSKQKGRNRVAVYEG